MYQTLNHQAKACEVLDRQFELLAAVHALQPEHAKLLDWTQISEGSTAKVQHGNSIHLMTQEKHY